jgi:hypothetical protein
VPFLETLLKLDLFGIAFSSFSDALLMSSTLVKRRPFKVFFIFGNKKKTVGAITGEYGGWGRFLAKTLRTSNDEIQQFWNEFCCHSFHAQNIRKKFYDMSQLICQLHLLLL